MINKNKLKKTIYLNGLTIKDFSKELGMSYANFNRHVNNNSFKLKTIKLIMDKLEFKLYSPREVFFDS